MEKRDKISVKMTKRVKKPGWARGFKSHDKTIKRLMTGAKAVINDADKAEETRRT